MVFGFFFDFCVECVSTFCNNDNKNQKIERKNVERKIFFFELLFMSVENKVTTKKQGKTKSVSMIANVQDLQALWTCIDRIVCINLQERTDRKKKMLKLFERLGIQKLVSFYQPTKDPQGGVHGCAESHFAVLREAYDAGCKNILIFEDDPDELTRPTTNVLEELIHFITNQDIAWDMLTLGVYPRLFFNQTHCVPKKLLIGKKKYEMYKHVRRVQSICSHAYIASRAFMEKMYPLRFKNLGIPIDNIYEQNQHTYAVFPTWFYQTNSPSNIASTVLGNNFMRKMFVAGMSKYASQVNIPGLYVTILCILLLLFVIIVLATLLVRKNKK